MTSNKEIWTALLDQLHPHADDPYVNMVIDDLRTYIIPRGFTPDDVIERQVGTFLREVLKQTATGWEIVVAKKVIASASV